MRQATFLLTGDKAIKIIRKKGKGRQETKKHFPKLTKTQMLYCLKKYSSKSPVRHIKPIPEIAEPVN